LLLRRILVKSPAKPRTFTGNPEPIFTGVGCHFTADSAIRKYVERDIAQTAGPDYQLFYNAFKASPIGIALEDLEGRPLYVNSALCSMLGYSEEELRNKHCSDFSPPEDAAKDWAMFQQLRAGSIDHYSLEKRFYRRDGSLTWGRLSISKLHHRASPLVIAMVEDITPVRESEERFRLVANTAPVMIWLSGTDKLCTYVNRPWLDFTGRTIEQELGSGWVDLIHPDDRERSFNLYAEAFDSRHSFTVEYRLRRRDGEYRWVLDSGVPTFNKDGSFAGYIGSAVDVTDHKKAEEALFSLGGRLIEAQEQERRHIARELHDDISQKLAVLSIELQQLALLLPDSQPDLRKRVEGLMNSTSEVTDDVHALSHRLHSAKLEAVGLLPTMRGFCRELAEQRDVNIDFTDNDVPDSVSLPVSLCLFRVLQEALNNAVKHSGARDFEARIERVADDLQLTVRDRGVGFDPEVAMYKEGIGLISMKERASLVKGTVSIVSKPHGGTCITARCPLSG
jgi:PAS domain S-box-containing protein